MMDRRTLVSALWWQERYRDRGGRVRGVLLIAGVTIVFSALLLLSLRSLGAQSPLRALAIVWLPMAWLGTVSHVVGMQLTSGYHRLRQFEVDGRCYERLGVRLFKRLLRRGPFALFNPGLHLPPDRSADELAKLEQRMRTAETTHFVLLVATLPVVGDALARGAWAAAGYTFALDVLVNGYPVMLQRYNRALLRQRFGHLVG